MHIDSDSSFTPAEDTAPAIFRAIYHALDADSQALIGPAAPQLLVIPIRDASGGVTGGLWGVTSFAWLHLQMLFVPETLRGQGVGSALVARAEAEARARGCRGAYVGAFSFQALPFYQRCGFVAYGVLDDFPPGHQRVCLQKRFDAQPGTERSVSRRCSSKANRSVMPAM